MKEVYQNLRNSTYAFETAMSVKSIKRIYLITTSILVSKNTTFFF